MGEKECSRCNEALPATLEYFHANGNGKLYSSCKKCKSAQDKEAYRKHLEENDNQEKLERCTSCQTSTGNIITDVNEKTKETKGYLCTKCFRIMRDFSGDPRRLRYVADYIENIEARSEFKKRY